MAIDRRPFIDAERLADYERRLTALVKRLIASEPNIEQRCQMLDAWLELNPLPSRASKWKTLLDFCERTKTAH